MAKENVNSGLSDLSALVLCPVVFNHEMLDGSCLETLKPNASPD
jgi:hypothetical protein